MKSELFFIPVMALQNMKNKILSRIYFSDISSFLKVWLLNRYGEREDRKRGSLPRVRPAPKWAYPPTYSLFIAFSQHWTTSQIWTTKAHQTVSKATCSDLDVVWPPSVYVLKGWPHCGGIKRWWSLWGGTQCNVICSEYSPQMGFMLVLRSSQN